MSKNKLIVIPAVLHAQLKWIAAQTGMKISAIAARAISKELKFFADKVD